MRVKKILCSILAIAMMLSTMSFSVFAEGTYIAQVGDVGCANATEMLHALNAASGEVTVEIYGKLETNGFGLNNPNIEKLSFVGKTNDAEICVDGISYIDVRYTEYPIEYTGLILSHINAGQNIDGYLPQYFSTYNSANVTYNGCTFPNGVTACGNIPGTTYTFNDCTFNNTTSGFYSLWIYGNSTNVVINGGEFCGVRGIKMYSEGSDDFSSLSVSEATFFNTITEKHAIVLTKGESITLTDNTFNNTTGKVEVDNDYASLIDGKTVTIDGAEYVVDSDNFVLEEVTPAGPVLSGAGIETDPYLIENIDDLKAFRDDVNAGNTYEGKYVALTADINLSGEVWTPIGSSIYGKTPADADVKMFAGNFDGGNHTITGLTSESYVPAAEDISDGEYSFGLFGYVYGANISNVKLADVNIEGTTRQDSEGNNVGGSGVAALIGYYYVADGKECVIENCHVLDGTVVASNNMGGLIGFIDSQKTVPQNVDISIINCSNAADVTSEAREAGGIVGLLNASREKWDYTATMAGNITFKGCINTGDITTLAGGGSTFAAGILGKDQNEYSNQQVKITFDGCENSGTITVNARGETHVAAIGSSMYSHGAWLVVKNSKNTGDIVVVNPENAGLLYAGGLLGYAGVMDVIDSTSTGAVTVGTEAGNKYIGDVQNMVFVDGIDDFNAINTGDIYYLNGGTSPEFEALVDDIAYSGGNFNVIVKKAYKDDFEFGGWYDNKECTGTPVTTVAAGSDTYYAKWIGPVAKIGDAKFYSLQDAVDMAEDGDVITLVDDVTFSDVLVYADRNAKTWNGSYAFDLRITKELTLDLNGFTLKSTGGSDVQHYAIICVDGEGNLTVVDSSDEKTGAIINATTSRPAGKMSVVLYNEAGDITLNGGTYSNQARVDGNYPYVIDSITAGDTSLTINEGVKLVSDGYMTLRAMSQGSAGTQTVNINGGEFEGGIWAVLKNGVKDVLNFTISDGTFTAENAFIVENYAAPAEGSTVDTVSITGGTFNGNVGIGANNVANLLADGFISGGSFSNDPTPYVADNYAAVSNANGNFHVVEETLFVDEIKVEFELASEAEGEKVYNINLTADGNVINRLNSVDLTFLFTQVEGANEYEIIASNGEVAVNPVDNSKVRYEFHYNGKTDVTTDTNATITIGQVKFTGYGKFSFAVDANANDTNAAHATKLFDNIVDTFVPGGILADGTEVGDFDITDNTITDVEITVPTRTLTIDITFPNAVENNVADYQDMTVTIVGGTVNETIALGTDGEAYNFTRELPYNTAYTVTVSGAGYRTARYTVNLNDDKQLNFWNNVMDEAQVVEIGKDSSVAKVTFLAGDIVKDNNINIYDLSAVVSYFGEELDTAAYSEYAKYDLNRDGVIDSKDVAYVLVSWNN